MNSLNTISKLPTRQIGLESEWFLSFCNSLNLSFLIWNADNNNSCLKMIVVGIKWENAYKVFSIMLCCMLSIYISITNSQSQSVSHSVVSDSLWPHGLKPARPLCPWDFPGKNSGVGCHFLLQENLLDSGIKPESAYCSWILYHLSHQGNIIHFLSIETQ